MGPTWGPPGSCRPQMAPCWPHEPCYQGVFPCYIYSHSVTGATQLSKSSLIVINSTKNRPNQSCKHITRSKPEKIQSGSPPRHLDISVTIVIEKNAFHNFSRTNVTLHRFSWPEILSKIFHSQRKSNLKCKLLESWALNVSVTLATNLVKCWRVVQFIIKVLSLLTMFYWHLASLLTHIGVDECVK